MKTKNFFAGIIAGLVAVYLTALSVSAAVKDVSIQLNGPGQVYIIEDEMEGESYSFYFLDVYSSQAKLINAAELEGATEFTIYFKATNTTSYSDDIDVTLDIEVDENNPTGTTYDSGITLKGDGEYKISTKLDSRFKADPNKLGIFLQLDFCGDDWPAKNQIPDIQVREIIVKKDVADTDSTDTTGSTGNIDNTDNTDDVDNTDYADNIGNTDDTGDADSTIDDGFTDKTEKTENAIEDNTYEDITTDSSATESDTGSNTNYTTLVILLVVIAIILGLVLLVAIKKAKQKLK